MKTFLRAFFFIALLALNMKKSNAQCAVSNFVIQNVTVIGSTDTSCTTKFDVTFNIKNNNGNKYIFLHAWLQNDYPDYFQCVNGQTTLNGSILAPETSDLGRLFINIGLNNDTQMPTIITTYPPDASLQMTIIDSVRKVVMADGSANIILFGVVATAPVVCGTPIVIVADFWSSQSSHTQRVHCVSCGIRYSDGYLNVRGSVNCSNLTYAGSITNNTNIAIDGYYRVFADINRDGYFTPATDTLIQGNTIFNVGASASLSISGTVPGANLNQNVFIVITQTSGLATGASKVTLFRSPQCGPLPVTFRSFTAARSSNTIVVLRWETVTEINNSGFAIQRNIGNNSWELVSFITTQAPGGNSSSPLTYTFNDMNLNKGITQYRIKQVDFDGRASYSAIQVVRGTVEKGKLIIYPNPSTDGRVSIMFEDKEGTRDITLANMNGHIVKQWKGITNNTLQIENLGTGMYTLRVIMRETGNQSVERIIVF